MKRISIAVLAGSLLSGCATELKNEAAADTNENVMKYVANGLPDCTTSSILQNLSDINRKEMVYRENTGRMNAKQDAEQINGAISLCKQHKQQVEAAKA
ncbi:hypothetical protein PGN80_13145 [Klebsiella aerogenes]|uniref:hypothetical protein n=1 Tax=Klebsiella aerogenes TaxID=548 RepID=UPI00301C58EB